MTLAKATLADYTLTPQAWAEAICRRLGDAVECIVGTGRLLIDAKKALPHGEYLRLFNDHADPIEPTIPWGRTTGARLAKIAAHPVLSNDALVQHLPASWGTLYEVSKAEPAQVEAWIADGTLTPETKRKDIAGLLKKQKYEARRDRYNLGANTSGDRWQVRLGDFNEVLADIEPGSIDAIVTDPPYPKEFLPLWSDLGALGARVLRPGGVLVAWSGHMYLPEVLNRLNESPPLHYTWAFSLQLPGAQCRVRQVNMLQAWKPILIYTHTEWGPHDWGPDVIESAGRVKDDYEWQQSIEPAIEIIDRFVPPGGLVLDPMLGVGTFGQAAIRAGRRFLGVEIDQERHAISCSKLEAEAAEVVAA